MVLFLPVILGRRGIKDGNWGLYIYNGTGCVNANYFAGDALRQILG